MWWWWWWWWCVCVCLWWCVFVVVCVCGGVCVCVVVVVVVCVCVCVCVGGWVVVVVVCVCVWCVYVCVYGWWWWWWWWCVCVCVCVVCGVCVFSLSLPPSTLLRACPSFAVSFSVSMVFFLSLSLHPPLSFSCFSPSSHDGMKRMQKSRSFSKAKTHLALRLRLPTVILPS